jgi:hypothetical protein
MLRCAAILDFVHLQADTLASTAFLV